MATVEQSVELADQQTGELREVDVLITAASGDHVLRIGLEATDRRGGTPWVESMITKHQGGRLSDKLILVAAGGFTRGALKKAEAHNVELVTLGDAESVDWAETVGKYASLWFAKVDLSPETVSLTVKSPEGTGLLVIGADTVVVSADRTKRSTLLQFVHFVLKQASVLRDVYAQADREKLTTFDVDGTVDEEAYALDTAGNAHLISAFHIKGGLAFSILEFQIQKNSYRDAAIGHAEFEIDGRKVVVAIVEKQGAEATFSVNLSDKDNDPGTAADLGE